MGRQSRWSTEPSKKRKLQLRKAENGWLTPDATAWCYLCQQPHARAQCQRIAAQVPA